MRTTPTRTNERLLARQTGIALPAGPVASVDLFWLPLGAGGHSVCLNERIFEAVVARLEKRDRCDLYHSALEVACRRDGS